MNDVDDVASHLASRIAPEEIDLAPAVARILIEEGPDAPDLQGIPGEAGQLGGSGIEIIQDLLTKEVMMCLAGCAGMLVDVLDLSGRGAGLVLRIRDRLRGSDAGVVEGMHDTARTVEIAVSALAGQLVARGHARDRADEISRESVLALLDMPEKARGFLAALVHRQ